MRRRARGLVTAAAAATLPLVVLSLQGWAAEQPETMKPGPGLAEVNANCTACHSLGYIRMNAPFLGADAWRAEVTKMRRAFGAPISDSDAEKILAYLAANYGPAP